MKTMRLLSLLCALVLCVCLLGACGDKTDNEPSSPTGQFGTQLEKPTVGETVAVMHTTMGNISIRLFPNAAPKAVENFITLSRNGYYDGITFHRVINNFMIQSGDPEGTGRGGESCWGKDFEDEFHADYGNLRGALAMANAGSNTNGSQFFINQAGPDSDASIAGMREMYDIYGGEENGTFAEFLAMYMGLDAAKLTDEVIKVYEEVGGNINLDGPLRASGGHTVFGQVYEGMDVVDAIAAVKTDEDDKPEEDVIIKTIEIKTFEG